MRSKSLAFLGLRRLRRKRHVVKTRGERRDAAGCECDPLFERLADRIRQDRRTIVTHITQSNTRLSHRLDSLERRTHHEVSDQCYHGHHQSRPHHHHRVAGETVAGEAEGEHRGGAERVPGPGGQEKYQRQTGVVSEAGAERWSPQTRDLRLARGQ